ncbi:MAG: hypothetical protein ABEN55_22980 [Bradymonadaceae bacterium]
MPTQPTRRRIDRRSPTAVRRPGCEPETAPGRRAIEAPASYGPDDRAQWTTEMAALQATERWLDNHADAHEDVRRALARSPDIGPVAARIDARSGGPLRESDLFQLKQFAYFGRRALSAAEGLVAEYDAPANMPDYLDDISRTIHPGAADSPQFHLSRRLDEDLAAALDRRDELREALRTTREPLEEAVVDRLGGSFDLQGRYRPGDATDEAELVETDDLTREDGLWRLSSREVVELEEKLADLDSDIEAIERRIRRELTDRLVAHVDRLVRIGETLRDLDVRLAKVRLGRSLDGCWAHWRADEPSSSSAVEQKTSEQTASGQNTVSETTSDGVVGLEGGREPRLAEIVGESEVQPIDFELGERPAVITGPNMGGKSSLLRLAGLCLWCAQHAMPVPANGFGFRPVHGIRYVGSEEPTALDADEGLSSFGREIRRLVDTRESCEAPTLWLLDEVGRGTHPEDGAALAIDVIERLHDEGHDVLAATHFPDVAAHEAFALFQIRGIVDPDLLDEQLDGTRTVEQMEEVLREAMDFQPDAAEAGSVPRGARIVARALGLDVN